MSLRRSVSGGVARESHSNRRSTSNEVSGTVHGPVVQAGRIQGDVHVHHHYAHHPAPLIGPDPGRRFDLGPEVTVGDRTYLVHEHPAAAVATGDNAAVVRQARCLRLVPRGRCAWLRQVEVRHDTPLARRARQALVEEHRLLRDVRVPGLPEVVQFDVAEDTTTLVTVWPETRNGGPCDTLDSLLHGPGDTPRAWLCDALAGLCGTLGALRDRGVAHGGLTPAGLIVLDDGALALRDLGLVAATSGRDPRSDVHQVGALAHLLLAGRPPDDRTPLPLRSWAPDVPAPLAAAVDAALDPDAARRPDLGSLGALLRAARAHVR